MPTGPPSTGIAWTDSPFDTSDQAPGGNWSSSSPAPYGARSASPSRIVYVGRISDSSWITSGAPVPASRAVENLPYSSAPWPALVQQIWTSSCRELNVSTICSTAGYHAHIVTRVASGSWIVLVQVAAADPPPPPPPLPSLWAHAASASVTRPVAAAATPRRMLLRMPIPPRVGRVSTS